MAKTQFAGDGSRKITDAIDIEDWSQGSISLTTTVAFAAPGDGEGIYDVWCAVDCYVHVGPDAASLTTSTGYLLRAGNTIPLMVRKNSGIGGILASGANTLYYHRIM